MADRKLERAAQAAKLAESIKTFSIHGEAKPFYDFGDHDFTDRRLCEASALCSMIEAGLRESDGEVDNLIVEIKSDALNGIATLIDMALLSHRWQHYGAAQ